MRASPWVLLASLLILACTAASPEDVPPPEGEERDGGPADGDPAVDPGAAPPAGWDDALKVPLARDENPDEGIVEVTIEAKVARVPTLEGKTSELWTYNGTVPGPTIRAKKGDRVIVHFKNALPEATTTHWHGLRVPNAMDGTPETQPPIEPGTSFDYDFRVPDGGTFWYHPHVRSSLQVGYGLYGAFVIDEGKPTVTAPDLTMVFSDMSVADDGTLRPGDEQGSLGNFFGREGNLLLVNGKRLGRLAARPGAPQRWRLINASRARFLKLRLDGFRVFALGSDGGLASSAKELDGESPLVSTGERAELLVIPTGKSGERVKVAWVSHDRFRTGAPVVAKPILEVSLEGEAYGGKAEPQGALATRDDLSLEGAGSQLFRFTDVGGKLGINGKTAPDMEMLTSRVNTVEIWSVQNATAQDHPFHLHGFFFQVLDDNGLVPKRREWKDTLNVAPNTTVRLAVPFDGRKGHWMVHCHILDHAEGGMMAMLMTE